MPVSLRDSTEMEEFIPLLLVAVQEVIIDDDIELDLIEEYANRHNMDNEPRWLFGPTPHVSIANYVQDTVGRYSDDLFKRHFRMSRNAYEVL